jgi:hypothetical protein
MIYLQDLYNCLVSRLPKYLTVPRGDDLCLQIGEQERKLVAITFG